MKRHHLCSSVLLSLVSLQLACQDSAIQDQRVKTSGRENAASDGVPANKSQLRFKLTWTEQATPVTTYHVFYNKALASNKGGEEIDSIDLKEDDTRPTELMIDKTNMASFPAKGSQICFYVVADNQGVFSDPSEAICTKI